MTLNSTGPRKRLPGKRHLQLRNGSCPLPGGRGPQPVPATQMRLPRVRTAQASLANRHRHLQWLARPLSDQARSLMSLRCSSASGIGLAAIVRALLCVASLVALLPLASPAALAQSKAAVDGSAVSATSSDASDLPAKGWTLPWLDLHVGGYASASLDKLDGQEPRLGLDHLSLFVWWEGQGRWRFLSELDAENSLNTSATAPEGSNHYVALERAYFDYAATDSDNLRIGKFLTPVGRWNTIHAAPLVWTSARPMVTTMSYPTNLTGVMAFGSVDVGHQSLEYAIYGSGTRDLRNNPDTDAIHAAIGGRAAWLMTPNAKWGLSLLNFQSSADAEERQQLVGIDGSWANHGYEVLAEGIYRFSDHPQNWDQQGGYLQLVVPVVTRWFWVQRYEYLHVAGQTHATQLWLEGLNYHFNETTALKAEWIGARDNTLHTPTGVLTSVSILF